MTKTLLELARQATPGPWQSTEGTVWVEVHCEPRCCNHPLLNLSGEPECCGCPDYDLAQERVAESSADDAAFIAAANPQRIIELCEALEALIKAYGHLHGSFFDSTMEDHEVVVRARRALSGE